MRVVVQRVLEAAVTVEEQEIARIGAGALVLVAVARGDNAAVIGPCAEKLRTLRLFAGAGGNFDRSILDVTGELLVVSQFTLYGDTRKGRRPDFTMAAPAAQAAPLVEALAERLRAVGVRVQTGRFGADMQVSLVNDGPVTLLLDF